MIVDDKNNKILGNNINSNLNQTNGINYLHNRDIIVIDTNINRRRNARRNLKNLQSIETYDLLEDTKMRGKNCVDTGTYRNNRNF